VAREEPESFAIRTFEDAVTFLEQGIDYEKTNRWLYDRRHLNVRRVEEMLAAIGSPHQRYRIFHVAGTKGKGSTSGAIACCLQQGGYRTGLLTSPHLVTHRERIQVDARMIDLEAFRQVVCKIQPHVEQKRRAERETYMRAPTYFEMLTVLALEYFAQQQVDWAVVEVGLGGTLDSTNVVQPDCCVVTSIGFDHTDKLGDTIEAIATEKAGILKEGVPVMLGRQPYEGALHTLRRIADERHSPRWEVGREVGISHARPLAAPLSEPEAEVGWRFGLSTPGAGYPELTTPLLGRHQIENIAAAVGAIEMVRHYAGLRIEPGAVAEAVAGFRIPARVEVLQRGPAVVLDVAHTVESIDALLEALDTHFPGRRLRVVFGCSAGKKLSGMLQSLIPRCLRFTATQANLPRAMPAEEVAAAARLAASGGATQPEVRTVRDPWQALQEAVDAAEPDEVVCVTGSFYVAGEVRAGWLKEHPQPED